MIIHERGYVYNFNFHLVFVTKYRKKIFDTPEKVQEMKDLLQKRAEQIDTKIEEMEVMPDHVHLLISFKPIYSASYIVKMLKGTTARQWFLKHPEDQKKLWGGHLWSPSYFISTLGDMSKETVRKYIASQYTTAMKKAIEREERKQKEKRG